MRKHKYKIAGILVVMLAAAVLIHRYEKTEQANRQQQEIAEEIIRLHVIANSDSPEDQQLKMEVKEIIVNDLREAMEDADSIEKAREVIVGRLPEIENLAEEKMRQEGYDYTAEATLGECYFPVKEYGDLTFPAGEYEALRVKLGASEGRNWWCVMYPTLCFVDSTYQIVPEESKEKLKSSLTHEEYNSLLDGGEDVTYSWKIVEWIQNLI
jgi:stage II sporulation protein R